MQNQKYDAAVVIGRFQPFHNGHKALVNEAFKVAKRVIVVVGSADMPRTPKNPFTYEERARMIKGTFPNEFINKEIDVVPVVDTIYSNQQWVSQVQFQVDTQINPTDKVVLVGHHRDDSSFYLDMFPQWKYREVGELNGDICGTGIRDLYYDNPYDDELIAHVPFATFEVMEQIAANQALAGEDHAFNILRAEDRHIKEYKKAWAAAPYAPTFVTVDAVVVQSGHVLMIQRKRTPGRGLWAIPGGFIDPGETIVDGIIRELREETKLKVPDKVLKGCIKNVEVFDAPGRSLRGRTITHAALIELDGGHELPRVKGADDAAQARWIPISVLRDMRSKMFEDHFDIVFKMINSL